MEQQQGNPAAKPLTETLRSEMRAKARALAESLLMFDDIEAFLDSEEQEIGRNGAPQTAFMRENEDGDLLLSAVFGADGRLVHYAAGSELHTASPQDRPALTIAELRNAAETFAREEYPDFPAGFDGREVREHEAGATFVYTQIASGIPLPESGFRIEVNPIGFVSVFIFEGRKPEPARPAKSRTPEQALRIFADRLTLKLGIHFLHKQAYEQGDDRLHLVYMAEAYASLLPADAEEQSPAVKPYANLLPDREDSHAETVPPDRQESCAQALEAARREQPELAPFLVYALQENVFPPAQDLLDAESEDGSETMSFRFAVRKNGLPIFKRELEADVNVEIDRGSGRPTFYLGSDIDAAELAALSAVPAFSEEEARRRLLASLRAKPVWTLERTGPAAERYRLAYRMEHRESGRLVMGVDAADGRILTCGFF
ncbi:hypothetical protein CDO73_17025 [Saccharibacillus sp. O23]|uniref:YcdB/YcdC domain-containing protein n=1 Tax=Saccharibacillus sp. O23 TaxID=2009338 RepID=UPI000B4E166B|nr:YcdB/YcdC domain-containing protein [Saccharibacillus sp. O23]OWR28912.1 hypothetical protein CDO73_17025 [Saccharibacillus sp. O23]